MEQDEAPDNSLSAFLIRWLTGANSGYCGKLYIGPFNKGTALYFRNNALASFVGGIVRLHHMYDEFGIKKLTAKLNITTVDYQAEDFKENGWLKPEVLNRV